MSQTQTDSSWNPNLCCICGSLNCYQSVDHLKITISELQGIVGKSKHKAEQIDEVKVNIRKTYKQIKERFIEKIERDEHAFQEFINQFYYPHLTGKVNIPLLSQLTQHNYEQLPTKSIGKLVKIMKSRRKPSFDTEQVTESLEEIKGFLNKLNIQGITNKPLRYLAVEKIINSTNELQPLESKKSFSEMYNPEETAISPANYEWKNIKITKHSRTAQFNNKNLKDQDLIREVPSLSCFKNLKEFQARNNFLTSLSCKIIVNNLDFIQGLDIRGNRIGDSGIEIVAKGLPNLKNLLISQTETTDVGGQWIIGSFQHLELFWAESNSLSGPVILTIASKPKLKVMSVSGNPIDDRHKSLLHQLFVHKGYIVI